MCEKVLSSQLFRVFRKWYLFLIKINKQLLPLELVQDRQFQHHRAHLSPIQYKQIILLFY